MYPVQTVATGCSLRVPKIVAENTPTPLSSERRVLALGRQVGHAADSGDCEAVRALAEAIVKV